MFSHTWSVWKQTSSHLVRGYIVVVWYVVLNCVWNKRRAKVQLICRYTGHLYNRHQDRSFPRVKKCISLHVKWMGTEEDCLKRGENSHGEKSPVCAALTPMRQIMSNVRILHYIVLFFSFSNASYNKQLLISKWSNLRVFCSQTTVYGVLTCSYWYRTLFLAFVWMPASVPTAEGNKWLCCGLRLPACAALCLRAVCGAAIWYGGFTELLNVNLTVSEQMLTCLGAQVSWSLSVHLSWQEILFS